jgi:RHS repeat-associated protein
VPDAQYTVTPRPPFSNNRRAINPVTGAAMTYDGAGNLTSDGAQSFTYDATWQQAAASGAGLTQAYDGDGLRVRKTENGVTTYYLRSSVLGGRVVAEVGGSDGSYPGKMTKGYVYLGGQMLAVQEGREDASVPDRVLWVHQDPVTKSQRLTNIAGDVVTTVDLDPWGGETNESSNVGSQPQRYTSYLRDANGGDEAMFRRYENRLPRFSQPDPADGSYDLSDPQSLNRYSYTQNDPVNLTDPSGLLTCMPGNFSAECGIGGFGGWGWGNLMDRPRMGQGRVIKVWGAYKGEDNKWHEELLDEEYFGGDDSGEFSLGGFLPDKKKKKNKYITRGDSCDEIQNAIEQLINGESKPGSSKGLRDRFAEQIYGNNGPGTESWKNHEQNINDMLASLRDALDALDKNKCGPPKTRGANSWAGRSAPSASEWRGGRTFYMDTGPLPITAPGPLWTSPCIFPCIIS